MKTLIIIPARYGSTRLPGKPLLKIAGVSMLQRTYTIAKHATEKLANVDIVIATDDQRILEHSKKFSAHCVMTAATCQTGTDRVLAAIKQLDYIPDLVINLQGDAPLTPPNFIVALITAMADTNSVEVATLAAQLNWHELDKLRAHKKSSPFSGTTVIINADNNALWFSKNIIPAIRDEQNLREQMSLAPIYRHIGIYAFRYEMLQKYASMQQTYYEKLEGLEQLRLLEHGYAIHVVPVSYAGKETIAGIDTMKDLKLAEKLILEYGEIV